MNIVTVYLYALSLCKRLLSGALLVVWVVLGLTGGVQAQVTTNGGSGLAPTYTSLQNAITALNAAAITTPVIITLNGNETAPVGGYEIRAVGTAANTITIQGNSSTITAFSPQVAGRYYDAIFKIIGGDFIILQNFSMIENALNTNTTPATEQYD